MSDAIATINGRHAMAYLGETPWHKLGTAISPEIAANLDAMMAAAGLDWEVQLQPIQLAGSGIIIPGSMATVRIEKDGTIVPLATVGTDYRVIQQTQATEILRPLVEDLGCSIVTAGALQDGRTCWALAKLPDATVAPVPGDDVRGYGLLSWSHDGQSKLRLIATGIRVVCWNTLSMALGGARGRSWVDVKHTSSAAAKLDEAVNIVRQLSAAMKATGDTFSKLARMRMNPEQLRAYIATVIPNTTPTTDPAKVSKTIAARRETIEQLAYTGKGADMASSLVNTQDDAVSLWAAYNAVTEYFDHVRTAEATSDAGMMRAAQSALFGGNAQAKAQALAEAQQLLGMAA